MKELCEQRGLPSYTVGERGEVCPWFLANRRLLPYIDLRPCARWRPTEIAMTNRELIARVAVGHLVVVSRYVSKWYVRQDVMYTFDHRGLTGIIADR